MQKLILAISLALIVTGCATPFQQSLKQRAEFDLLAAGGKPNEIHPQVYDLNGAHFTPESFARRSNPTSWFFAQAGDVTLNAAMYGAAGYAAYLVAEEMDGDKNGPTYNIHNNSGHISISEDIGDGGSQSSSGNDYTEGK